MGALQQTLLAVAITAVISGGSAPTILGTARGENIGWNPATATLSGVQAGDLIVVFAGAWATGDVAMVVADTISGTYSDTNAYTLVAGPIDCVAGTDASLLSAWTAVAAASGAVTVKVSGMAYNSIVALRIGGYDPVILDVAAAADSIESAGASETFSVNMANTVSANTLVLGGFSGYRWARVFSFAAEWPMVAGRSSGEGNGPPMIVVAKTAALAGAHDPQIIAPPEGSEIAGIAIAIRGVA